jgi:hypothetical protein
MCFNPYFINQSASAVTPTRKPTADAKVRSRAISSGEHRWMMTAGRLKYI